MIQEFSIQNYISFRDKETISMQATKDRTLQEELTVEVKTGVRLLRLIVVYGANASGKTNLLLAIESLWSLLFYPTINKFQKIRNYQPFVLLRGEPTQIECTFWVNTRRYQYTLHYNEEEILYEKMLYTTDSDVLSLMYERKKGEKPELGGTLRVRAKEREKLFDNTFANHTLLSTFGKINIDIPIMNELYEWIRENLNEGAAHPDEVAIAREAENNPKLKSLILEMLEKADFNISDFRLIEFPMRMRINGSIVSEASANSYGAHEEYPTKQQIVFTHESEDGSFPINLNMESEGTKAYFRLARLLFDLKKNNAFILEDELDSGLHYDLLIHYLQTFLQTPSRSQLIMATHNQMILNEDWMIRRDMVWFTEKDRKRCCTQLYSAASLGLHKNISLLNAYRVGKLGAKPMLGSTYLTQDDL